MNGLDADMDGLMEAVRVSCDATAHPSLRNKALQHIAQMEAAPSTWMMCMQGLANGYWTTPEAQFYSYKVVEKAVRERYGSLSLEDQQHLHQFLLSRLRNADPATAPFIRNKIAQLFALVFVRSYPRGWPAFFEDVIAYTHHRPGADLYVRILHAIDEQIGATDISRSEEEAAAAAAAKDAVRDHAVPLIARSWLNIVHTYASHDPELAAECLDVVALYVLWVDAGVIVNNEFHQLLNTCLSSSPAMREAACRVVDAVLTKGMPAQGRLEVVRTLGVVEMLEGVYAAAEAEADTDLAGECAAITNTLLVTLIGGLAELIPESNDVEVTWTAVQRILDLALALFSHDDDGVSERLVPGINTYLQHLKHRRELTEEERESFGSIATKAMHKLRFEGTDEFENEDALALFMAFRAQLKAVLVNVSHIDTERLLSIAAGSVSELLTPDTASGEWQDAELGLHIVFVMQEVGASFPLQQEDDSGTTRPTAMGAMLQEAVAFPISEGCPEPMLQKYFEVLGRATKYLVGGEDRLTHALSAFFSPAGMRHPSRRLRRRCCYLLCTLLRDKGVREAAAAHIPTIVEHLLPYVDPSGGLQEEQGRLNLLEAVSWLLAHRSVAMQETVHRLCQFVDPMQRAFSQQLQEAVSNPGTAAQQEHRASTLVYIIHAVMRLSKGFSKLDADAETAELHALFSRALAAFLEALAVPALPTVHQAVRMFLHRMIVVLGRGVLNDLPLAVSRLLQQPSANDLEEFVPLVVHLIHKFRTEFAPFLQEFFLPFVQTVFEVLGQEVEANDMDARQQRRDLRRAYFTLIGAIVNTNLTHVFTADTNRPALHDVLMSLVQGATATPDDPRAIKSCFGSLRELTRQWVGEDGTCKVPGFETFAREHLVEACFTAILQPSFDVNDVQYYGALGEVASTLLLLTRAYGSEFLEYVHVQYLQHLISADLAQEFVAHLDQSAAVSLKAGKKRLSAFLKHLLLRMRAVPASPSSAA